MMLAPLRDNRARQTVAVTTTFPSPVEGWDSSTALANMKKLRAVQLTNWFPQPDRVEMRRGWQRHARIAYGSVVPIETLMAWNGTSSSKMFMAGGGVIYDATTAGEAVSSVTGLSEDRWQTVNMTTSAGAFLFIVNGTDAPRHYNGSAWATPTITGTGITASDFIHVNVHKKRLWFVINNSTDAAYLGTDAISGTATKFSVGANFDKGGHLVAMTTWTLDGGAGPDDYAAFISSEGQVAVYQGTDPASASTFGIIGVYNLAKPIGRRCVIKYGSSPLILTVAGVLQLSMSLRQDAADLTVSALTQRINPTMNTAARSYSSLFGWDMCVYPKGTRLIVNVPTAESSTAIQYVMNTITGAWCDFNGHNANCWLVYQDNLYFGTNTGSVAKADQTGSDGGTDIVAIGQTAYDAMKSPGQLKRFTMAQPLILTEGSTRVSVGVSADFVETSAISTPSAATSGASVWDTARWDIDVWGGQSTFVNDWTSTPALGRFGSIKFTASTGGGLRWGEAQWSQAAWFSSAAEVTLQINGFVLLAEVGGVL